MKVHFQTEALLPGVLDIYDVRPQAMATGTAYPTRLDLPTTRDWTPPEVCDKVLQRH